MWITSTILGLLGVNALLLAIVLVRQRDSALLAAIGGASERGERNVREEFARNRDETSASARVLRPRCSCSPPAGQCANVFVA